MFRIYG